MAVTKTTKILSSYRVSAKSCLLRRKNWPEDEIAKRPSDKYSIKSTNSSSRGRSNLETMFLSKFLGNSNPCKNLIIHSKLDLKDE